MNHSGGFRRIVVRVQDVLIPFLVLFTLNLIILVSWTAIDPLQWVRLEMRSFDQFGRSVASYGTCQSEWELLFYVLIAAVVICSLLVANIANYRARHISGQLHEGKWITLSALILLEAIIIGIPAVLAVRDKPTDFFVMRSVLVLIVCAAILLPLFIPKIVQARQDGYATRPSAQGRRHRGSGSNLPGPRTSFHGQSVVSQHWH